MKSVGDSEESQRLLTAPINFCLGIPCKLMMTSGKSQQPPGIGKGSLERVVKECDTSMPQSREQAAAGGYHLDECISKVQNFHSPRSPSPSSSSKSWILYLLLWLTLMSDPFLKSYVANGLPLVTSNGLVVRTMRLDIGGTTTDNMITSGMEHREEEEYGSFSSESGLQPEGIVELTPTFEIQSNNPPMTKPYLDYTKRNEKQQASTSLDNLRITSLRRKKGLSYLSKYYSQSVLNNTNSHDFFGLSNGGRSTSVERLPSVRRKLSFSPPLAYHGGFISPWSRVGKPTTMRLRWGK